MITRPDKGHRLIHDQGLEDKDVFEKLQADYQRFLEIEQLLARSHGDGRRRPGVFAGARSGARWRRSRCLTAVTSS